MMAHLQEAGARDGGQWKEQGQIPRQKKSPPIALITEGFGVIWAQTRGDSTLNPKTSELGQALYKLGVRRD